MKNTEEKNICQVNNQSIPSVSLWDPIQIIFLLGPKVNITKQSSGNVYLQIFDWQMQTVAVWCHTALQPIWIQLSFPDDCTKILCGLTEMNEMLY